MYVVRTYILYIAICVSCPPRIVLRPYYYYFLVVVFSFIRRSIYLIIEKMAYQSNLVSSFNCNKIPRGRQTFCTITAIALPLGHLFPNFFNRRGEFR